MQLITCFLYICMILYDNCAPVLGATPIRKMAQNRTCGAKACAERTAQDQVCGCDRWCEVYGDCCPDYTRPADDSGPPEASLPSLLYPTPVGCVDTQVDGGYLLVSTCPANWKHDDVSTACEAYSYGLSPAYVIPVASRKSNISYKNMFCAYCHGQTLYDIKLWPFSYWCDPFGENFTFASMFIHAAEQTRSNNCAIKFDEPTRRPCLAGVQDCDNVHVRDDTTLAVARDMCNTYTDYASSKRAVYKNQYCQVCHQGAETTPLVCDVHWHLLTGRAPLSILARIHTNKEYEHNKDPAITYTFLKEEEATCRSLYDAMYVRNGCRRRHCPKGYSSNKTHCSVPEIVRQEFVWCSPGWDTNKPPIQYVGELNIWTHLTAECDNSTDSVINYKNFRGEDVMMESIRVVLGETNYRKMYLHRFLTAPQMFGNCQSATTTGTVSDNNAQLLAFMEQAWSNLTWPWIATLTMKQEDGEIYRGDASVCELIPMCRLVYVCGGELGNDLPNVSFTIDGCVYVCEEVLKSIENSEREQRNKRLLEFLKRAEKVHVPTDSCTTAKMGAALVVMLLVWV